MSEMLKAPFPWFGGKSRAASLIWKAIGDVPNYVEPFAGSLAVLLGRPHEPKTETVNDLDCYLANFWRAVGKDPDDVARWADAPVNEADLHAKHRWLVERIEFRERVKSDPDFYDAKIAGWWVWGQCCWIGSGWCAAAFRQRGDGHPPQQLPHLGDAGMGIHRKLPHLGDAGRGALIRGYMRDLCERLRGVRVACGDWRRVTSPAVTTRHGTTGVVLDPPYGEGVVDYSSGGNASASVADAVREWAIENGGDPKMRIVLCGYDGQHDMPSSWRAVPWHARKGYAATDEALGNVKRERLWLSPHCLPIADEGSKTGSLFGDNAA